MQTLMKTLVIASTLLAGTVAAMAGSDGTYHWGYPDSLKSSVAPVQPFGGESGIPAQYR